MFDLEGFDSQIESNSERIGLTQSEMDYVRESVELGNADWVVERIDELSERIPPLAVDSNPVVAELIEPIRDQIPDECLEAPTDIEQIERISETMQGIEGLDYEIWKNLNCEERLDVLRELEEEVAEIAHRPVCDIRMEDLGDPSTHKGYCIQNQCGNNSTITINSECLADNSMSEFLDTLDTVIHEGRHAYQNYNLDHREVNPNTELTADWRQNMEEGYHSPELFGFRAYWNQPVEADARDFAKISISLFSESKGYLA